MSEPKANEKKVARRSVAVAFGTVSIVFAFSSVGVFAYYVPLIDDKKQHDWRERSRD